MKRIKMLLMAMFAISLISCNQNNSQKSENSFSFSVSIQSTKSISNTACNSSYHYGNIGNVPTLDENGFYNTKEDVALYIVTFHKLPSNYIDKSLYNYRVNNNIDMPPETRIGGDTYFNSDGDLPNIGGYKEVDVDASGPSGSQRGTHRLCYITYNNTVFYTYDHYDHWQEYLGYKNWGPTFSSGNYYPICK